MHIYSRPYTPLFQRLIQIEIETFRLACFFSALTFYAIAGLPTPDHPGVAEIIIAGLLILAVGLPDAAAALRPGLQEIPWKFFGKALLIYGLSVALVAGVMQGHPASLILRDMIPFMFLVLPVLMAGLSERPASPRLMLAGVLMVGLVFALRAVIEAYHGILPLLFFSKSSELTYLANAPTILFAGLFLFGAAGERLLREFTLRSLMIFIFCTGLALLTLLPPLLTAQRASMAYAVFYVAIVGVLGLYYYPRRMIVIIAMIAAAALPLSGIISHAVDQLMQKHVLVGLNMRAQELQAIWQRITETPFTLIFGTGWGGTFESPAVGGVRVNFTHSLLTSAVLKTGMAGFILVILYLFSLAGVLLALIRRNPVLALALAGPVLIDTFLYASFKSFDFGLILLLITAFAAPPLKLHKHAACCIQKD